MKNNSNGCSRLMMGTMVGGLLAVTAAFLLAPKKGCELREDITDMLAKKYGELEDMLEDYSPKRLWAPEPETNHTGFFVSAVVGGVLAAGAALLLTPKTGDDLRKDIADFSESGTEQVKELVENFANRRKGALHHARQRLRRK